MRVSEMPKPDSELNRPKWYSEASETLDQCEIPFKRIIKQRNLQSLYSVEDIKQLILVKTHDRINSGLMYVDYSDFIQFYTVTEGVKKSIKSLRAYFQTIGTRIIIEISKKNKTDRSVIYIDEYNHSHVNEESLELEIQEEIEFIRQNVSKVDFKILMLYGDDFSSKEISDYLQVNDLGTYSPAAIRKRIQRSIDALKKMDWPDK
jgi:hypothetical protein